eukprot:CAMPEP_0178404342 /NCGR_PEP_ID=MMETSP0689_2-20121128/17833_1 /TAXON_ID=160604 /ORGANISM="Amphidinium massartii, Strain CS-259" /LENGTH=219 /DNA_ID=CAMNT_0020025321 /DNA_START=92 /DNA_END=751 /DNA_ORIENTATION=-
MPRLAQAAVALAMVVHAARAMELTKDNWDDAVAGKTVFVKFLAALVRPLQEDEADWDKLMAEFKSSSSTLIADVDCTTGGKALCEEVGVRGYPTIKYGDPSDLQDYKGGRDLASLKKFAEGLGPTCSPANLDLCDEAKKKQISEFLALSSSKRAEMIKEKEGTITKLEADFKKFVDGLQSSYKTKSDEKDKAVEEIKTSGLGLLKSVHAYSEKTGKSEL